VAVDEPSALAVAEIDPPDVVLLAGTLPGVSPWELARRIPRHPAGRRPFLIVLVGDVREVDRRRSGEAGVDLVLVRPVDLDLLHGVLNRFHRILLPPEPAPFSAGAGTGRSISPSSYRIPEDEP
jgi:CheY-like chemotaxis protein